jgi:hypothetical protein
MSRAHNTDILEIPTSIWESAETKEELEDWLLSQNPKLINQLLRIRRVEDLTGKGKSLDEIAKQWDISL